MKHYIAPTAALAMASALLGLQIQGVFEYTAGGSEYTRNTMIAAAVMVALLPVVVEAAWERRAYFSSLVMAFSTAALLWYSIPATLGRIGEAKEAKLVAHGDVETARAELAEINKTLPLATADRDAECTGAPSPLPVQGWPECKRKRASVTAFENRRHELEQAIKSGPAVGDVGSDIMSWALFGAKAETIRNSQALTYVLGMDLSVFGLMCFVASCLRGRHTVKAISEEGQFSDDDLGGLRKLLDGNPPELPPTNAVEFEPKGSEVINWAKAFETKHGRAPRLDEATAAFPSISRSTVYRRLCQAA